MKSNLKKTKKDKDNIVKAYYHKVEEFNKLTLDQLKDLYQNKKIGGIYKVALLDVVNSKLQQVKEETITETIESVKNEEINDQQE